MNLKAVLSFSLCLAASSAAIADEIIFKNGDKLTGVIGTVDGGKMKITSKVAGEITVDLADVQTFTTDAPIELRMNDGSEVTEKVTAGDAGQVKGADGKVIAFDSVKKMNPPAEAWSGSILVNGLLQRGNTDTGNLGVAIGASLRRDNNRENDRFTVGGAYNLGTTGRGDNSNTTTDNWNALGKYDKFWNPQFYTYGLMKVEHDRISHLNYRLSPGVGLGYQWIESERQNLSTEAGISYVYEDFSDFFTLKTLGNGTVKSVRVDGTSDDHIAGRLAYHYDRKLSDTVTFFSNGEWVPAFEDPSDYNATIDAGLRAKLTKAMFSEFKVVLNRDSVPAPGTLKNDLTYILGVGWTF